MKRYAFIVALACFLAGVSGQLLVAGSDDSFEDFDPLYEDTDW